MNTLMVIGASIGAAAVVALAAGGAVWLGRRVVMPRPAKLVAITVNESGTRVTLPLTPTTRAPGEHGLWFDNGHARIGHVTTLDEAAGLVEREILLVTGGDLSMARHGRWSGHVYGRAEHADAHAHAHAQEIHIDTAHDRASAWLFTAAEASDIWAIHVHGIRSSRYSALRSVPIALELGMTSLVPSYYGDRDNPGNGTRPCYLGQREWRDVEAALDYAVAHGARRIVLFGWSMGGMISLLLSEHSRHRDRIAGIVLISPATHLRETLVHAARNAGLPSAIARRVPLALETWPLTRLCGLAERIDFDELDWSCPGRLRVSTLALHSDGDTDIPAALTRTFVEANPGFATLALLEPVPHQLEWNAAPERFNAIVAAWLQEHAITTTRLPATGSPRQYTGSDDGMRQGER
ncbi:alpha/beta hydrolase family protein [Rathayibacter toxicus]|uniref:alpha/beta hydrolase family protein n=1 Tax=Rathayibacter toxicus TaxID=145458 RepID=UPI000D4D80BC|nr:alpha/beta hydrolase [Rathayibacter toxicus]PPI56261.1 alpha/beta hydrolase [Rathayibacter toxicus]QOD09942.1 alpha/beta hydrolase [Rathayibacter toxicus]QWL28618.1 alpha/beta hydrolase [Rathayibacter toxicus]